MLWVTALASTALGWGSGLQAPSCGTRGLWHCWCGGVLRSPPGGGVQDVCRECGPWQRGAPLLWGLECAAVPSSGLLVMEPRDTRPPEDPERQGEHDEGRAEGSHSAPTEVRGGDPSPPSWRAPVGEGPSLCPAVVPPVPPAAAAASAPSISSRPGWKEEGKGRGGLSGVSR